MLSRPRLYSPASPSLPLTVLSAGCHLFGRRLQSRNCNASGCFQNQILMYNFAPMGELRSSGGQIHPKLRKVLLFALLTGGAAVCVSVFWIFQRIDSSLGDDLAQAAIALISVLVFALMLVGMRTGLCVDRFVRQRKLDQYRVYRTSSQVQYLCAMLGYQAAPPPEVSTPSRNEDLLALLEKPKHRGRPPTYSIDRWKKVVLAWESRDPVRTPLTLSEFLVEQFGTHADGSPLMSENTFYDYRKKVIEELRRAADKANART